MGQEYQVRVGFPSINDEPGWTGSGLGFVIAD